MSIHPTAVVHASSDLGKDVEIGPYSIVEAHVRIGERCKLGPHVHICENTLLGKDCVVHHGAVIGGIPQDQKFKGEETYTLIGDRNVIREYVTINRGTAGGGGRTVIGNDNLIMCYVHVAHDCQLANHIIVSAYAGLAGHIVVEDRAVIAGMVGIHHFCRIGSMSYIGGMSKVTQDIPPYIMADGIPCRFRGLNLVGLRRRKLDPGAIAALKETYRVLFMNKVGNLSETLEKFKGSEEYSFPEVRQLVNFIEERALNAQGRFLENAREGG